MEREQEPGVDHASADNIGIERLDQAVGWGLLALVAFVVAFVAALQLGVPANTLLGVGCVIGGAAQAWQAPRFKKWGERALAAARAAVYCGAGLALVLGKLPTPYAAAALLLVLAVSFRTLRKALSMGLLQVGWRMSRRSSPAAIGRVRRVGLSALSVLPPIRLMMVRNMQRAGVYESDLPRRYLDRAGDQMEQLMHIARAGFRDSGVADLYRFDDSVEHLRKAHAAGRGVVVVAPHLCGYPIFPRLLDEIVPCSIFLRRSPSDAKHAINMAIGKAGGGHLVFIPDNTPPTAQLNLAMKILRDGRGLFITPDVPRKADEGVPVQIFGRMAYFPTGSFLMAMRTGAPVVSALWYYNDGRYHVRFSAPQWFESRGDRRARLEQATVEFAREMDAFLHQHPEMWWNWLDKRWTRILRGRDKGVTEGTQFAA